MKEGGPTMLLGPSIHESTPGTWQVWLRLPRDGYAHATEAIVWYHASRDGLGYWRCSICSGDERIERCPHVDVVQEADITTLCSCGNIACERIPGLYPTAVCPAHYNEMKQAKEDPL